MMNTILYINCIVSIIQSLTGNKVFRKEVGKTLWYHHTNMGIDK